MQRWLVAELEMGGRGFEAVVLKLNPSLNYEFQCATKYAECTRSVRNLIVGRRSKW